MVLLGNANFRESGKSLGEKDLQTPLALDKNNLNAYAARNPAQQDKRARLGGRWPPKGVARTPPCLNSL